MNRYLARWNELLAPLGWVDPPFTDCDQAAYVLCELRTDLVWLERLTAVFPSGDLIFARLREQVVRVLGDPPVQTDHLHMAGAKARALDEDLVGLAQSAASKISSLTAESFSDAQPVIVRESPREGQPALVDTWWPASEVLGDKVIEVGCDSPPETSEAVDLLRECLYQLECTYILPNHVLWPYYAPSVPGAEPYMDLLALWNAGMTYLGVNDDGRLGIIMGSAL